MKTFPSNFIAEKDKPAGAAPVWILKCPFASGTVYISDRAVTVTGWDGGPTTLAWVRDWGRVEEDISGVMASPRVSDMALKLLNDPEASVNIALILDDPANAVETTDCELYLWFTGLDATTDPPQLMWTGNMVDWVKEDELVYALELVDQSVRVDKYIGEKIDKTTYPEADPDDVGKVGNIAYGTVSKVPARSVVAGALDWLDAAISAAQTTLDLVDASEFPSSGTVGIEEEEITYTGKTGNQLTGLTRAANGTTAATHARGSVVWQGRDDFTYEAFSHPIKQFDNIYAEGHNTRLKITGVCTLYTGKTGSQHPTWANRAMVVVPSKITKAQAVELLIQDGITVNDAIAVVDTIAVSDTITVNDLLTISDPTHGHTVGSDRTSVKKRGTGVAAQSGVTNPANAYDGNQNSYASINNNGYLDISFSPPAGTKYGAWIWVKCDGGPQLRVNGSNTGFYPTANQWVSYYTTNTNITSAGVINNSGGARVLYEVEVEYDYTPSQSAAAGSTGVNRSGSVSKGGGASKTGSASKSGSATKAGTVTMTGNSVADAIVADRVLVDAQGYEDDGSGTFTGTPNALIERPDHIFKHFLYAYAGWPVADFQTDAEASFAADGYKFAVVINEYRRLKEWLNYMAWQCRCWFRFYAGKAQLLYRPDSLASGKTITAAMVRMNEDSRTTMRVSRSPLSEVVNKVSLHYDRDWTQSGSEAYREVAEATDSTSITKYGEKEKPELFDFDFIRDAAMAADLRDFYLARYKDRKKLVSMEVFLDNAELEFADAVTITPEGNLLAEVERVNIYPGSGREMRNDRITLVVRGY